MTVMTDFIEPMLRAFNAPPGSDAGSFFTDLTEDLNRFSGPVLQDAVRYIRRHRKFHTFPTIGECYAACQEVSEAPLTPVTKARLPWEPKLEDLAEKARIRRHACGICRCQMGQEADAQGWLPSLIEFAEKHARLPQGREIDGLRATAARHERNIEQLDDDARRFRLQTNLAPAVADFRRIMLDKAHRDVFQAGQPRLIAGEQGYGHAPPDTAKHIAKATEAAQRPMPALSSGLRANLGLPPDPEPGRFHDEAAE